MRIEQDPEKNPLVDKIIGLVVHHGPKPTVNFILGNCPEQYWIDYLTLALQLGYHLGAAVTSNGFGEEFGEDDEGATLIRTQISGNN